MTLNAQTAFNVANEQMFDEFRRTLRTSTRSKTPRPLTLWKKRMCVDGDLVTVMDSALGT